MHRKLVKSNEALASRFDKRAEDLIGACIWDLMSSEIVNHRKPYFESVLQTGNPVRFEDIRDGTWFDNIMYPITNEFGEVTEVAIYARDITERKQLESDLQDSVEKSKALLNAPTDLIALHNLDGIILEANAAMASRFNLTVDQIIGRCVWDYFPPEVAEHRKKYADRVIESGKPVRFQDQNRGDWFDTTLYPLCDADGNVNKFAVFVRKIKNKSDVDSNGV